MAFGQIGKVAFFGLPGNPVAVAATFKMLVAPALRQLLGEPAKQTIRLRAICTTELAKSKGRMAFMRGILRQDESGEFWVSSAGGQGSNMLGSLSKSNCFIILPADCTGVEAGQWVDVEPFTALV